MIINNQINEEIKKLNSLIKTARHMILKGTITDISAIKNNTHKICELMKIDNSKKNLIITLEKLIDNLDFLALDLVKTFGWLAGDCPKQTDSEQ